MAPVITEHSYWTSVLKACELSVLLLTAYKEVPLVEHTLQALQHFVRHGQTLDEAMAYKLPAPGEDRPVFSSNSSKKKRGPMAVEPLDHWDVRASHIDVPLQGRREVNSNDNNQETQRMRCHQVTTMAQVEAMKDALYASEKRIVSLDCEFLAIKKQQPQLKVVQLAASMHEGFAVLVDDFDDKDALRSALMALLEDNHFTFVGWAVRADAQAIESFIGGIRLPHILDLQAAVCRDATQRMNLKNAMLQYAKEWPFTDEFAKAKEFGDTFRYLEYDCVWDYRPFPTTALVYAVFDVTTLIALHDVFESRKIAFQETDFWPLTVTTNSSNKNLGKWIQQRAMNDVPINTNRGLIYLDSKTKPLASSATSSSNDAAESIVSTGHASDTSPREQQSDDQANDEDQFEKDIRRAILLSLQETEASSSSLTPSPKATAESHTPPAATSTDKLSNSTSNSTTKSAKSTKSSKSSHFAQSGPFSTDATDTQSKSATPVPSAVLSRGMAQPKVVAEDAFTFEDLVSTTQTEHRASRGTKIDEQDTADYKQQQKQDEKNDKQETEDELDDEDDDDDDFLFAEPDEFKPSTKLPYQAPMAPDTWGEPETVVADIEPGAPWDANLQESSFVAPGAGAQWRMSQQQASPTLHRRTSGSGSNHSSSSNLYASAQQVPNASKSSNSVSSSSPPASSSTTHAARTRATSKWNSDWSMASRTRMTGSMTYEPQAGAGWSNFAEKAMDGWQRNADTNMSDYERVIDKTHQQQQQQHQKSFDQPPKSPHYGQNPQNLARSRGSPANSPHHQPQRTANTSNAAPVVRRFHGAAAPNVVDQWTTARDGWEVSSPPATAMILPLAGIPTRKTYGPKVTNIYDDGYDDDDHDDMSMEMADDENTTPLRGVSVDNGFRDELFLHEGRTVNFYCLSTFEHMNNMDWTQPADGSKCPSQIVVSISPFFRQTSNRTQDICALGLFVNTGHSYSVVLDHTLADPERLATTKLAKLLVDPSIRRISFRLQGLVHALNDKLGFPIGNFVDLDTLDDDNNTFDGMFKEYLHNWPSAGQYHTAKDEFTQISGAKKFNGSPWTRTTVPLGCLTFSACQGAMWHALDRAISQR